MLALFYRSVVLFFFFPTRDSKWNSTWSEVLHCTSFCSLLSHPSHRASLSPLHAWRNGKWKQTRFNFLAAGRWKIKWKARAKLHLPSVELIAAEIKAQVVQAKPTTKIVHLERKKTLRQMFTVAGFRVARFLASPESPQKGKRSFDYIFGPRFASLFEAKLCVVDWSIFIGREKKVSAMSAALKRRIFN